MKFAVLLIMGGFIFITGLYQHKADKLARIEAKPQIEAGFYYSLEEGELIAYPKTNFCIKSITKH